MKLGRFAILMFGITVFVVALFWAVVYKKMPNDKEIEMLAKNTSDNNDQANLMSKAKDRTKKAEKMVDQKADEWNAIVATRTPGTSLATNGIDLSVNDWQLAVDTPKYRNSIQRAVNAQVKKGGVIVVNSPNVPLVDTSLPATDILASFYNYPAIPFPVVIFDFGTITVQGTYKQIMDNVRAYKSMPHYLAVADGLRIDGTSPNLTGTYNLTIVGFLKTKKIAKAVPESAGGGNAGGGMMGGMGGMFGPGGRKGGARQAGM